jgi:hypothetical protein
MRSKLIPTKLKRGKTSIACKDFKMFGKIVSKAS